MIKTLFLLLIFMTTSAVANVQCSEFWESNTLEADLEFFNGEEGDLSDPLFYLAKRFVFGSDVLEQELPERVYIDPGAETLISRGVIVSADGNIAPLKIEEYGDLWGDKNGLYTLRALGGYELTAKRRRANWLERKIPGLGREYFYDLQWKALEESTPVVDVKVNAKEYLSKEGVSSLVAEQLGLSHTFRAVDESGAQVAKLKELIFKSQEDAFNLLLHRLKNGERVTFEDLLEMSVHINEYVRVGSVFDGSGFYKRDLIIKKPEDAHLIQGVLRGGARDQIGEDMSSIMQGERLLDYPTGDLVKSLTHEFLSRLNKIKAGSSLEEIASNYLLFISIHPFYDGNGRIARALTDYMLLKAGLAPGFSSSTSADPSLAHEHLWISPRDLAEQFIRVRKANKNRN